MSDVKGDFPEGERHLVATLGAAMDRARRELMQGDWQGLRPSHLRVIALVPPEGVNVTELADRLGMTKQGCGQFVTHLVGTGHLATTTDPEDARVRLVRRTTLGEQNVRDVTSFNDEIEARWRQTIGERRWATFRSVLDDIATGVVDPGR